MPLSISQRSTAWAAFALLQVKSVASSMRSWRYHIMCSLVSLFVSSIIFLVKPCINCVRESWSYVTLCLVFPLVHYHGAMRLSWRPKLQPLPHILILICYLYLQHVSNFQSQLISYLLLFGYHEITLGQIMMVNFRHLMMTQTLHV